MAMSAASRFRLKIQLIQSQRWQYFIYMMHWECSLFVWLCPTCHCKFISLLGRALILFTYLWKCKPSQRSRLSKLDQGLNMAHLLWQCSDMILALISTLDVTARVSLTKKSIYSWITLIATSLWPTAGRLLTAFQIIVSTTFLPFFSGKIIPTWTRIRFV